MTPTELEAGTVPGSLESRCNKMLMQDATKLPGLKVADLRDSNSVICSGCPTREECFAECQHSF